MIQMNWIGVCAVLGACTGAAAAEDLSREFKLPLQLAAFEASPEAATAAYARALSRLIQRSHGVDAGDASKPDKTRQVRFLDTPGTCTLRKAGFILRERADDKRRQVTLKTRSPDSSWVMQTRLDTPNAKSKLEEDISAPLEARLSRSATLALKGAAPASLEAASGLFPVLTTLAARDEPLETVEGLTVREVGYQLPRWISQGVGFEADLSLWYDSAGKLLFSEASFRYDVPAAGADNAATQAAALFRAMQADASWAGTRSQTKTEFVYTATGGKFCR